MRDAYHRLHRRRDRRFFSRYPIIKSGGKARVDLERRVVRIRWALLAACVCSLPFWGVADRSLLAGVIVIAGAANWRLKRSLN